MQGYKYYTYQMSFKYKQEHYLCHGPNVVPIDPVMLADVLRVRPRDFKAQHFFFRQSVLSLFHLHRARDRSRVPLAFPPGLDPRSKLHPDAVIFDAVIGEQLVPSRNGPNDADAAVDAIFHIWGMPRAHAVVDESRAGL